MDAFSKNLSALIEDRRLTQQEFADSIGVSLTTVNGWLRRGVQPKAFSIDAIASKYGLSSDDLLSATSGFYAKAHGLTEAPAGALAPREPRRAYAPLYGRVHAGGAGAPDLLEDRIPIPYEVFEHHQHGYFLEVEGSCMNRVYPEGCFIFIDPDQPPRNGSIAVVSIDGGDYVMRRLLRGANAFILAPESFDGQWEDIVFREGDGHQVEMVGTVVWYQPQREME
ncbi:hypothetical protein AAY81_04090 [Denitrobacterium detoxificans]|uniref:Repressor LexA n=1 Tax=Denitrobacterium detoxificans TaxID=79604 RepID=A0A172RXI3_9ACTN|nr:XRE family transcriptional regulator [Denitrobacterium detoxificans]ANE22436.1 hypothetical protein AAY81_04090 [Denitrobacterium detoxificans]SEO81367.1 repressor LexA [Denitrobacterium detoxificans]SEP01419.1 repressor LexA [Denitrobacterium detoxificans]